MKPNQQQIFDVIKKHTVQVLIDVDPNAVTIDTSLSELGANSIDRVEIVMYSMQDLDINIPRTQFQGVRDLRSLVDLFSRYCK